MTGCAVSVIVVQDHQHLQVHIYEFGHRIHIPGQIRGINQKQHQIGLQVQYGRNLIEREETHAPGTCITKRPGGIVHNCLIQTHNGNLDTRDTGLAGMWDYRAGSAISVTKQVV